MFRTLAGIALGAALVSIPAAAVAEEAKSSGDEMVCKSQKRTGTRFASKVCHTRKQWNAIAEANKRNYAETRDRPVIDITRPN